MALVHQEIRNWGEGILAIGFESQGNWLVADFSAKGKSYGPVKLFDLPEPYLDRDRMEWAIRQTFAMFDASQGGEKYFTELFGPEAAGLAYGEYRRKAKAAHEVIGHPEAVKLAENMLQAFYLENPPGSGKTPFDNWGILNKLATTTFGKFSFDELIEILREADDLAREGPSLGSRSKRRRRSSHGR